mgnify:FL=1
MTDVVGDWGTRTKKSWQIITEACEWKAAASGHGCAPNHEADFSWKEGKKSEIGGIVARLDEEVLVKVGQV